jgi:hypothetical protein
MERTQILRSLYVQCNIAKRQASAGREEQRRLALERTLRSNEQMLDDDEATGLPRKLVAMYEQQLRGEFNDGDGDGGGGNGGSGGSSGGGGGGGGGGSEVEFDAQTGHRIRSGVPPRRPASASSLGGRRTRHAPPMSRLQHQQQQQQQQQQQERPATTSPRPRSAGAAPLDTTAPTNAASTGAAFDTRALSLSKYQHAPLNAFSKTSMKRYATPHDNDHGGAAMSSTTAASAWTAAAVEGTLTASAMRLAPRPSQYDDDADDVGNDNDDDDGDDVSGGSVEAAAAHALGDAPMPSPTATIVAGRLSGSGLASATASVYHSNGGNTRPHAHRPSSATTTSARNSRASSSQRRHPLMAARRPVSAASTRPRRQILHPYH